MYPGEAAFGTIACDAVYQTTVTLTNVGNCGARFNVKKLPNVSFILKHTLGSVAPGMSVKLDIQLKAGVEPCDVREEFQVVSETEILHILVSARKTIIYVDVISKQRFDDEQRTVISPVKLVDLKNEAL